MSYWVAMLKWNNLDNNKNNLIKEYILCTNIWRVNKKGEDENRIKTSIHLNKHIYIWLLWHDWQMTELNNKLIDKENIVKHFSHLPWVAAKKFKF